MKDKTDRNDELAALARLVIYARGCAGIIKATQVEERLNATLDAITSELGRTPDPVLADALGIPHSSVTIQ